MPVAKMRCKLLAQKASQYGYLAAILGWLVLTASTLGAADDFDVLSAILESPRFKGKTPAEKLVLAADLVRSNKLKQADISFVLLDWADQYLREPGDPLERLQRWAELTDDEKLGHLRLPRDFLNRMLLAEYLVNQTSYLKMSPYNKLELLGELEQRKLVDWSVFLAYSRVYAGGIIMGFKGYENTSPLQALKTLKTLMDKGMVNWHYRVPTEEILVAEALAMDRKYLDGSLTDRLAKLAELESKGLISPLTRKELEKLPAWRLLVDDPSFMKADPVVRRERVMRLRDQGLISASICSDLAGTFCPPAPGAPGEAKPAPMPRKSPTSVK
jgi:hypothetical protein